LHKKRLKITNFKYYFNKISIYFKLQFVLKGKK